MARRNHAHAQSGSWLRPRERSALGMCLLLGGLVGAVGYPEPGWVWLSSACAAIGASAAGVCVIGHRLGVGTAVNACAAGVVAALEGFVVTSVALRGDSEKADSLIGTTLMALVLGLVCGAIAGMLVHDDPDDTAGTE